MRGNTFKYNLNFFIIYYQAWWLDIHFSSFLSKNLVLGIEWEVDLKQGLDIKLEQIIQVIFLFMMIFNRSSAYRQLFLAVRSNFICFGNLTKGPGPKRKLTNTERKPTRAGKKYVRSSYNCSNTIIEKKMKKK